MNRIFTAVLFLLTVLAPGSILAVKAKPGLIDFHQPDGSVVKIRLHGDEKFHYATSAEDNLLILPNEDGYYEYAIRDASGKAILSGVNIAQPPRNIKGVPISSEEFLNLTDTSIKSIKKLNASDGLKYRYGTSVFPTVGSPNSLVILVEYPDFKFHPEDPLEYYKDFLNGDHFTRDEGTGSCRQYYVDNSNGIFNPVFDVYGPILTKHERSYYGKGYNDYNANQMVIEAIEALDPDVDFSQYDHNGDGYVDSVYIIYADMGQADGGPVDSVWPYSWELEIEGVNLVADGVKFNVYGMSNEYQAKGKMDGIGTFVHEFGHVLGLPDLYNTESTSDGSTPCDWSVMDSANYNNGSRTPAGFSSFEKFSLGWLDPKEILSSGEYIIGSLVDSNDAFIIATDENPDEFFMLEHRLKKNWDKYLPAEGMLVWHIDFDQKKWDDNIVNNTRNHKNVLLVRADNTYDQKSYAGDPFPGSQNVTEFGFSSVPALKSWDGNILNVSSISNIIKEDDQIKFYATVNEDRAPASIEDIKTQENKFSISGDVIRANAQEVCIYDITGRKITSVSPYSSVSLEKGLYIIGGRKIIIQ